MDPDLAQLLHALLNIGGGVFWIVIAILMIPISAIVLGIASGTIKTVVKSRDRRYQMRLEAQQAVVGLSDKGIQDLRDEIARLRDTTTEHAMSMQHAMDRMEQRVAYLERKTCEMPEAPQYQQPPQQTVGYR